MKGMPLTFANIGQNVTITDINGGECMCKKLKEMGFVNGSKIKVMRNDVGPIIVKIGDGRIILGRSMATKIMVAAG
ncbi:FeoA family protein [Haloimpatiens lingqiaonensis]|uniref:FeoA family protein n=1 Tax=Haloimpatiens lingqiaonensis TaxID=1380675 RepID=UPI0010FD47A6|nr:FeoA family protein [Haloimpatiens lingqiaonensis]